MPVNGEEAGGSRRRRRTEAREAESDVDERRSSRTNGVTNGEGISPVKRRRTVRQNSDVEPEDASDTLGADEARQSRKGKGRASVNGNGNGHGHLNGSQAEPESGDDEDADESVEAPQYRPEYERHPDGSVVRYMSYIASAD